MVQASCLSTVKPLLHWHQLFPTWQYHGPCPSLAVQMAKKLHSLVSQALSKFIRADCNKASLPGGTCSVPFLIRKGENSLKPYLRAASAFFYDRKDLLRSSPFELVGGNCDRFVIADEITLPYHVCGFSAIMSVVSLHRSLWYPLEYVFCR